MDKELKIFLWILAMILVVLMMLAAVFKAPPECFSESPETICEPQTQCNWARDQISQLFGDANNTPLSLKIPMIEAAMHVLRTNQQYIILYEHPEYQGAITLIDKNNKSTDIQLPDFPLYYGRQFSMMIPKGVAISFTPHNGGTYPHDPITLGEGQHPRIVYHKGPLKHIRLHDP
jgi:hypothetical protein